MIDSELKYRLWAAARRRRDEVVRFAQQLIQTRSLPGEEEEVAQLVASTLQRLGYDEVDFDEAGNVIGFIRGLGGGLSVQLSSHLDHVHEGDPTSWRYPPYAGVVVNGVLYGRGASDVKGALASQVYGLALLRDLGIRPVGDCYFTGVVQEEIGGLGAAALCRWLQTDSVVLGEATNLELRRGHRGRIEIEVRFVGRSAHASTPTQGVNPLFSLGRFLCRLEHLYHPVDEELGSSTVTPTYLETDQRSRNVIPGSVRVVLDWRTVPQEKAEDILQQVTSLAQSCAESGVTVLTTAVTRKARSYRGLELELSETQGYVLPADHWVLDRARTSLETVFGHPVRDGFWRFATDGGHFMQAGIPTIGFAPGEESLAHTVDDSVRLEDLEAATVGYAVLALALTRQEG